MREDARMRPRVRRSRITRVALASALAALAALVAGCGGGSGKPQELHIDVTHQGFVPARKVVRRGAPIVLVFRRLTDQTCGTDVVFPSLHRGYDLPLNQSVRVELSAQDLRDTLFFTCSSDILTGMLVPR